MKEIRTIKGYLSHIKKLSKNPVLSLKGFDTLDDELRDVIADCDGYICELAGILEEREKSELKR